MSSFKRVVQFRTFPGQYFPYALIERLQPTPLLQQCNHWNIKHNPSSSRELENQKHHPENFKPPLLCSEESVDHHLQWNNPEKQKDLVKYLLKYVGQGNFSLMSYNRKTKGVLVQENKILFRKKSHAVFTKMAIM